MRFKIKYYLEVYNFPSVKVSQYSVQVTNLREKAEKAVLQVRSLVWMGEGRVGGRG